MHKIMKLYDQLADTEKDARTFAECALLYKDSDRELADMYITLARTDADQCSRIHAQINRLISKYKTEHGEDSVPDALYEWHANKLTRELTELKVLIDSYK